MNSEKQKVLEMLSAGQISADEAARLLECLDDGTGAEKRPAGALQRADAQRMRGKKLRVQVNGYMEHDKKIDVNVSVPLILARYVDNIIATCIPDAALKEMKAQGIDLRQISIGQIVDTFESLEEDIVNADINQEDMALTVRIYVE